MGLSIAREPAGKAVVSESQDNITKQIQEAGLEADRQDTYPALNGGADPRPLQKNHPFRKEKNGRRIAVTGS